MTPRGGQREHQTGRPKRTEPKSLPVWCGQLSSQEREFIIKMLTPNERAAILLIMARKKEDEDNAQ